MKLLFFLIVFALLMLSAPVRADNCSGLKVTNWRGNALTLYDAQGKVAKKLTAADKKHLPATILRCRGKAYVINWNGEEWNIRKALVMTSGGHTIPVCEEVAGITKGSNERNRSAPGLGGQICREKK